MARFSFARMQPSSNRLVFVYNADSGLFNTASDIAHKLFSPDTYARDLCALTHGYFSMRKRWGAFIESLPLDSEFLHRDQFRERYPEIDAALPAVFRHRDGKLVELLSARAIGDCRSLEELEERIRAVVVE